MAEWEEKKGKLLITHALIFEAKQQKGTKGTSWFKTFSLQLLPGINLIILTLSSHTKQSITEYP